ncbi:hypothetical protein PV325_012978 [Microctonus aethiopoides]|nr:hypothetical protein PV325_012978 [Microctonus aethiopoides]KAK0092638.1 hypothetical protein PV326_000976 [Microctonus aethiopoides]
MAIKERGREICSGGKRNDRGRCGLAMLLSCAGCKKPIMDKFFLNVLDRAWHVDCVRCFDCGMELQEKCFSRESKIFCKNDFFRAMMNDPLCVYEKDLARDGDMPSPFDTYYTAVNECITNVLYTLRGTLHPNEKFISS